MMGRLFWLHLAIANFTEVFGTAFPFRFVRTYDRIVGKAFCQPGRTRNLRPGNQTQTACLATSTACLFAGAVPSTPE